MKRLEAEAQAAADAERQRREEAEAQRQRTGTKRRGRAPGPIWIPPRRRPRPTSPEPDLSIMKTANKGWDCCGNAQASVDDGCQIILACDVTAECNDKQQAEPMAQATRGQLDQAGNSPGADEAGERPLIPAAFWIRATSVGPRWRHWSVRVSIRTSRQGAATAPQCDHARGGGAGFAARDGQREDAGEAEDSRGSCGVLAAEGDRRACLWPDQGGTGLSRFLLRGLAKIRGEWRLVCLDP